MAEMTAGQPGQGRDVGSGGSGNSVVANAVANVSTDCHYANGGGTIGKPSKGAYEQRVLLPR
jgi:hypothetical protein